MTTTANDVPTSISHIRDRFESMACLNASFDNTLAFSFRAASTSCLHEISKSPVIPTTRRAAKPPPPKTKPKPTLVSTTLFNDVGTHCLGRISSTSSTSNTTVKRSAPSLNAIGPETPALKYIEDDVFSPESSGSSDGTDAASVERGLLTAVGESYPDGSSTAASLVDVGPTAFKTSPPPTGRHRKQKTEAMSESTVAMLISLSPTADSRFVSASAPDAEPSPQVASSLECSSENDDRSSSISNVIDQATTAAGGSSLQKRDDNEADVGVKRNVRLSINNQPTGSRKSYIVYAEQIGDSFLFLNDFDDYGETDDKEMPSPPSPLPPSPPARTDLELTAESNAVQISSTGSSLLSGAETDCHRAANAISDVNVSDNGIFPGMSSSSADVGPTAFKTPPIPAARHRKQKTEAKSESAIALTPDQPASSISGNANDRSETITYDAELLSTPVSDTQPDLRLDVSPFVIRSTPPPVPPSAHPTIPPPAPPTPVPATLSSTPPPSGNARKWIQLEDHPLSLAAPAAAAPDNLLSKKAEYRALVISKSQRPKTLYPPETNQDFGLQKSWSSELCLNSLPSTDFRAATVSQSLSLSPTADSRLVSASAPDAEPSPQVASSLECSSENDDRSSSISNVIDQATTAAGGSSLQKRDDNEADVGVKRNIRLSINNQPTGSRKSYIVYAEQIGDSFLFLNDFDDYGETDDKEMPSPPSPLPPSPPARTDLELTAENNAVQISSTGSSLLSGAETDCHRAANAISDVIVLGNGIVSGLTSFETNNSEATRSRDIRRPTTADIEDYKRLSMGRIDAISTVTDAFSFLEFDERV